MEDNNERYKKTIGFNRDRTDFKKESAKLEDYLNKWAFFKLKDGSSVAGYIENIDFVNVNLLPYQKMSAESDGKASYKIEEKGLPHILSKDFIGSFGETSKEEAENFCEFMNRRLDSEFIGQEQQKLNYLDSMNQQQDSHIITVPKNYNMDNLR